MPPKTITKQKQSTSDTYSPIPLQQPPREKPYLLRSVDNVTASVVQPFVENLLQADKVGFQESDTEDKLTNLDIGSETASMAEPVFTEPTFLGVINIMAKLLEKSEAH